MARFDVYPNPITQDRAALPYVLEIQSDLLYAFVERVCVPLVRNGAIPGLTERFNPTIRVDGEPLRLHPLGIAVFYTNELKSTVGSASTQALQIDAALDMLLRGY
jgi:toxin CcdB